MTLRKFVAELIGTFVLSLVAVLVPTMVPDPVISAIANGLVVLVLVSAFLVTSGAHFNPAVSVGLWAAKRLDGRACAAYVAAQTIGAVLGCVLVLGIFGGGDGVGAVAGSVPVLHPEINPVGGMIAEALATFLLVTVYCGTVIDKRAQAGAPLYIGLALVVGGLMTVGLTGAGLNPARYLGAALIGGAFTSDFWIYLVGPVVGGCIAALLYETLVLRPDRTLG